VCLCVIQFEGVNAPLGVGAVETKKKQYWPGEEHDELDSGKKSKTSGKDKVCTVNVAVSDKCGVVIPDFTIGLTHCNGVIFSVLPFQK
jgi:hypothetical protein